MDSSPETLTTNADSTEALVSSRPTLISGYHTEFEPHKIWLGFNRKLVRFEYDYPARAYHASHLSTTVKTLLSWLNANNILMCKVWNSNLFTIGAGILRKNNRCYLFHTSEDIIYIADDYKDFQHDDKESNLLEKVFFKYIKIYPNATIVNMSVTQISNLLVEPVLPKFKSLDEMRIFHNDLIEEIIHTRFNQ